jgi:hypothetical protein
VRSIEIAFDLVFMASKAVSFVPVYFGGANGAVRESYSGHALQLPPTATAVRAVASSQLSDALALRDGLDRRDLTENLEVPLSR